MARRRRLLVVLAVAPVLLVAITLLYLNFADLSGWRSTVEKLASNAIGRELRINGEFQPEIGLTTRVVATDLTLANPEWSDDPRMVAVHRLAGEIDLLSILFGPITIPDVTITGARVLFEVDSDGRFNWALGDGKTDGEPGGRVELIIGHASLHDVGLMYRSPQGRKLDATLESLELTDDGTGMLDLDLAGSLKETPLKISGRFGTAAGIVNATSLEFDLSGELNTIRLAAKGRIDNLKTLAGTDLTAKVHGKVLSDLEGLIELPSELAGPFDLTLEVTPAATGSAVQVTASAAGMSAGLDGTVDSLTDPKLVDATVNASGPSIRAVGSLTGVEDLPDDAFSVAGGVRWAGFPITFRKLDITVGENTLTADGVLGAPPVMAGSDFSIQGSGPDVASVGALVGIELPHDRYSVKGRLVRVEAGLEVNDFEMRIGRTRVLVDGRVGDPPTSAGTVLDVHAEGPNIAYFGPLARIGLPAEDFEIAGHLTLGDDSITLGGVTTRLGGNRLRVDGSLKTTRGLSGASLRVAAGGPDAAQLRALTQLPDLPAEAWSVAGGVTFVESGIELDDVEARIGSITANADGRVGTGHGAYGTDLKLRADDSDLAHAMPIFGLRGFPSQPVHAEGTLRIDESGYGLGQVTATAGDTDIAIDGLIGRGHHLAGSHAEVTVSGPDLSSVGPYFHLSGLPRASFSVTGEVRVATDRIDLAQVECEVDSNRATFDGSLGPVRGLVGSDLRIEASAPDLARAGRLAAQIVLLPELPAVPMTVSAHLTADAAGYEIDGFRASLDRLTLAVDGRVGSAADLAGTDLTVAVDGPDASILSGITGLDLPAAPMKVNGRLQRTDSAVVFDHVGVDVGGHSFRFHGSLGERPSLVGTDLDLYASGGDTGLVKDLTGLSGLPDRPFSVSGHFTGTPERFTARDLDVTLGASDVTGSLEIDLHGKPAFTAGLTSQHLDLDDMSARGPSDEDDQGATQPAGTVPKASKLISNAPLDVSWLQRADGALDLSIASFQAKLERFTDVELRARLSDGRLAVEHLAMKGSRGGHGSGSLDLEPVAAGYRAELSLDLDGVHFDPPARHAPDAPPGPPIDIDVRLRAEGATPHQLAASANGRIEVIVGSGPMDNRALNLISQDILITLMNAFNPFAKDQKTTELQCAIGLLTVVDGVATLEPMAAQSNLMTMLGKGKVDFRTERLDFDWVAKPRKGIGLSASMITNPYIRLGGTIAHPAIELKGTEAVATTGVAVATLGISLVAKGMLDRVTAEKKVCKRALEEIEDRTQKPPH